MALRQLQHFDEAEEFLTHALLISPSSSQAKVLLKTLETDRLLSRSAGSAGTQERFKLRGEVLPPAASLARVATPPPEEAGSPQSWVSPEKPSPSSASKHRADSEAAQKAVDEPVLTPVLSPIDAVPPPGMFPRSGAYAPSVDVAPALPMRWEFCVALQLLVFAVGLPLSKQIGHKLPFRYIATVLAPGLLTPDATVFKLTCILLVCGVWCPLIADGWIHAAQIVAALRVLLYPGNAIHAVATFIALAAATGVLASPACAASSVAAVVAAMIAVHTEEESRAAVLRFVSIPLSVFSSVALTASITSMMMLLILSGEEDSWYTPVDWRSTFIKR